MSNARDGEPPKPSMRPPQGPRPSKRPPEGEAPRPSKRPPEGEAPRPSKRPQGNPQRPQGNEAPRPSKRPQGQPQRPQGNEPPRPSKRPNEPPRPSRRPPHGPANPSIPRPPRMPGEAVAQPVDARAPQRGGPPPRPTQPQRGGQPPRPMQQGARPNDARPPERRPQPTPPQHAPEPRPVAVAEPIAPVEPVAAEPAPPRRLYLPLAEVSEVDALGEPEFPEYEWADHAALTGVAMARTAGAPRAVAVDAGNVALRKGETVVLESEQGIELAMVTSAPRRQLVTARLAMRVLRRAGEADLRAEARTRVREADAFRLASKVVHDLKLAAKVVRVECALAGGRSLVYLASEERLELRDVARSLTTALRGRVEIRHVGVRDAAKNIGGVGPCGLQLCCNTFLSEFAPVSIRHAKDQGLALTPQRVSGVCGRLMCCLVYEDAFYRQQRALFPKQGKRVTTPRGEGRVRDVDVLARTVRVAFADGHAETFAVEEVQALFAPDPAHRPAAAPSADEGPDDGAP